MTAVLGPPVPDQRLVQQDDELDGHKARHQIDDIDTRIAALLNERLHISRQMQRARVRSGGARVDLKREREIHDHYKASLGPVGREVADAVLTYCRGSADASDYEREGEALHADEQSSEPVR